MQRALEVGSGKNEPFGKHRERERGRDIHTKPPLPKGADLHRGIHLGKKKSKNKNKKSQPTKQKNPNKQKTSPQTQTTNQQVLVWTWKAFSAGKGGDAVIHRRHHLANLPNRLPWGTIYPLLNLLCVQCTLVLSSVSAQLPPALPTDR